MTFESKTWTSLRRLRIVDVNWVSWMARIAKLVGPAVACWEGRILGGLQFPSTVVPNLCSTGFVLLENATGVEIDPGCREADWSAGSLEVAEEVPYRSFAVQFLAP